MAHIRMQCTVAPASGLPRDGITNTLFFRTIPGVGGPDYMALATDLGNLFKTLGANLMPAGVGATTVKAYDMADAKPREPRATAVVPITGSGGAGPREVALCLSFRAERNLPRQRGRIFLGPIRNSLMLERPSSTMESPIAAFATGLGNLGGVDVDWVVHSRMDNDYKKVVAFWQDDEWDTQRSRGLRATKRTAGTTQ